METNPSPQDNRPEWLRALTEKSWNLELVISGAAIFLASHLPETVDSMLRFYLENWVLDEDLRKITLPLMVFSFMKVIAWLLIATFVTHFVMRAFWAGVVGLHTVYTEGIRYEKLPWQNEITRRQTQLRFGALSDYILRLDRLCNQVFSLAFLVALLSFGICIAYIFFFVMINVLPLWVGESEGRIVSYIVMTLFMLLAFLPVTMQGIMRIPRYAEKPKVKRLAEWSADRIGQIVMPLVYRPMSYLNLTFTSNTSPKRLVIAFSLGMVLLMGGVIFNFASTFFHLNGRTLLSTRDFYATSRNGYTLTSGLYDNMRSPEDRLPPVSIPSEVVEGPFLRVFVDYPKMLDAALLQRCDSPVFPDSLPKRLRRTLTDSVHLVCLNNFFQLSLNDSLLAQPGWMFHEHPVVGTPGVVAYLPAGNFKTGKNMLRVEVPSSKKPDSLRVYGELPFWYAPN